MRPYPGPQRPSESPDRNTKRIKVHNDVKANDGPEALMQNVKKDNKSCAKIRYDTLSQDRSTGEQALLLCALLDNKTNTSDAPKVHGSTGIKSRIAEAKLRSQRRRWGASKIDRYKERADSRSQPPSPRVPQGWEPVWNGQYKEWFYVNIHTKQSQWDTPKVPAFESNGQVSDSDGMLSRRSSWDLPGEMDEDGDFSGTKFSNMPGIEEPFEWEKPKSEEDVDVEWEQAASVKNYRRDASPAEAMLGTEDTSPPMIDAPSDAEMDWASEAYTYPRSTHPRPSPNIESQAEHRRKSWHWSKSSETDDEPVGFLQDTAPHPPARSVSPDECYLCDKEGKSCTFTNGRLNSCDNCSAQRLTCFPFRKVPARKSIHETLRGFVSGTGSSMDHSSINGTEIDGIAQQDRSRQQSKVARRSSTIRPFVAKNQHQGERSANSVITGSSETRLDKRPRLAKGVKRKRADVNFWTSL